MSGVTSWARNRRVSTKVLTVAGVAIAGMVVTGYMSLAGIADLETTRNDEIKSGVPYITGLNSAALAAKAAANDERGYLIAGDTKFRDEALGRQDAVNEDLAAARSLGEPAQQATIDEIKAAMDAWFTALEAEFTTFGTDRQAAVMAALGANRDLRKTYEGQLATEIERADKALIAGKQFDATVGSTRLSLIWTILLALGLAIFLALWVVRMIVTPLRRVSKVLEAVAEGDLSQDVDVDQKDELGHSWASRPPRSAT